MPERGTTMSEARILNPRVIVRPATRNVFTAVPFTATKKRRVAAYARVSTDSDEQYTSYVAQVDYYTNFIQNHSDWEFAGIYTDEGISGTSTKKRDGFNRMIADALAGKIDLIVTKSVSRFARNTVDSLTTIRKLKEHGVEVYFEKENIYSLDSKGELLLTIMSSLAQEESRSISENVTWASGSVLLTGRSACPTNTSWDTGAARTANLKSSKKKLQLCEKYTGCFWRERHPSELHRR